MYGDRLGFDRAGCDSRTAASLEAVQVNNCTTLVVKARTLNLTCDGAQTFVINGKEYAGSTGRLSRLVWATWGPRQAKGTGVLVTTGSGTIRRNVQVTLSKVRKQNGIAVFTGAMTTRGFDFDSNVWALKK